MLLMVINMNIFAHLFSFSTAAIRVALGVQMTGFVLLGGSITAAIRPAGLLGRDLSTVDQVTPSVETPSLVVHLRMSQQCDRRTR